MLVEDRVGNLHGTRGRFVGALPKPVGLIRMGLLEQSEEDIAPESFTGRVHRVRLLSAPSDREHLYPYQHLYELDRPCIIDGESVNRIVVSRIRIESDEFETKIFAANSCGWIVGDEFYVRQSGDTSVATVVEAFCDGEAGY